MEYECDDDTNCNWCTRNDSQRLRKGAGNGEFGGQAETL